MSTKPIAKDIYFISIFLSLHNTVKERERQRERERERNEIKFTQNRISYLSCLFFFFVATSEHNFEI